MDRGSRKPILSSELTVPWVKGQTAPGRAEGWGMCWKGRLGSDRKGLDPKAKETGMHSSSHWSLSDSREHK